MLVRVPCAAQGTRPTSVTLAEPPGAVVGRWLVTVAALGVLPRGPR
jgi:hypothetical protein